MKKIISLFLAVLLLVQPAFATVWYVSASATGSNNGTSLANAWTALSSIGTNMTAGDKCYVYSGTYNVLWTMGKAGTSSSARMNFIGIDSGGGVPIVRGIDSNGFSHIAIVNFEITQTGTPAYHAISLGGVIDWLIEDNYIHDTYNCGISRTSSPDVNSTLIIRHNRFADIGSVGQGAGNGGGPNVIGLLTGDSNLIEYNSVVHSLDRTLPFGTGNVIRHNYWGATSTALYPNTSPYPYHTDGMQSYQNASHPLIQLLYEKNYDTDNADPVGNTNGHGFLFQDDDSPPHGSTWSIKRFNQLIRPAGGAYSFQNMSRNYDYNNTYIGIYNGALSTSQTAAGYTYPNTYSPATSDLADVRNNTWSFCPNDVDSGGIIAYLPTNFTSARQHGYNSGATQVVFAAGSNPADLGHVDPKFVDGTGVSGHDNYNLQVTSPLIAAAAPITTASGSGTGSTTLTVVDAKRLFDGWSIADADKIKIGSGALVRIASINYSTNVVTLTAARDWLNGDGVYVQGSQDMAALPYGTGTPSIVSGSVSGVTGTVTATVTVSDAGNVRFVEILADNFPVATAYDPVGNVFLPTWTGDGLTHTFTARAYSLWSNTTLAVQTTISVGTIQQVRSARFPTKSISVTVP